MYDPGYRRIFCLVNPEKLSYNVADTSFRELNQILQVATKEKKRHGETLEHLLDFCFAPKAFLKLLLSPD